MCGGHQSDSSLARRVKARTHAGAQNGVGADKCILSGSSLRDAKVTLFAGLHWGLIRKIILNGHALDSCLRDMVFAAKTKVGSPSIIVGPNNWRKVNLVR